MAQSRHEKFVRLHWKEPKTGFRDGDSYAADLWLVDLGNKHFSNTDHKNLWEEAADYTRMRLRQIEEVEEQYYWLLHCTEFSTITPEQERARKTLINETSLRIKALKAGMQ